MLNFHESFFVEKMLKEFVEKRFVWLFVLVFAIGFVCAGEWDSFDENNLSENESEIPVLEKDLGNDSENLNLSEAGGDSSFVEQDSIVNGESFKYTGDFYIALGIGAVGILIVSLFVYLFLRRPKNRWKK